MTLVSFYPQWKDHYNHICSKAYKPSDYSDKPSADLFKHYNQKNSLHCTSKISTIILFPIMASLPHPRHLRPGKNSMQSYQILSQRLQLRLPLMSYDLCDIPFFIKSIQNPSHHFDIRTFICVCRHFTRLPSCNKLHVYTSSNKRRNFSLTDYLIHLTNLPAIDLTQPFLIIKTQNHFMKNFDPDNLHTLHFTCQCRICSNHPRPPNLFAQIYLVI